MHFFAKGAQNRAMLSCAMNEEVQQSNSTQTKQDNSFGNRAREVVSAALLLCKCFYFRFCSTPVPGNT